MSINFRNPLVHVVMVLLVTAAVAYIKRASVVHVALPNSVSVGFSQGTEGPSTAEGLVVDAVGAAKSSIHVAAYAFTSKPIAQALVSAEHRGVDVRIVVDEKENTHGSTEAAYTAAAGIPTRLDGHYAIMHNKFMVIDGNTVETGSFNYSDAAARKNAENALVLSGTPDLATPYDREFERLWNESQPYTLH